jgi:hypothetical protein
MQYLIGKSILALSICFSLPLFAQHKIGIQVIPASREHKIMIEADGKPFTTFLYPDSMEKPVLYPIYAPDQAIVTRGFPLAPRANDPTDHPHHVGLWLNYESVNGLDFWNNSYAIPPDKKSSYGWIRTDSILQTKNGNPGLLSYSANWKNQQQHVLLKEITRFVFSATDKERIIDRITTLTAQQDVLFADVKDGLLGLRVAHELELPSAQPKQFTDNKGNVTAISANTAASGNYLTSEGKQGDSAWSTRGRWCLLYGKINEDTVSIAIIDHPANPGYPTYWHARGYGLFAANPLGQKIFSNGKQELNYALKKGSSVTFRYRIVIGSGKARLAPDSINRLADDFAASTQ